MRTYWSMAITDDDKELFTYGSSLTLDKCKEVFRVWEDIFKLKELWIDVCEGTKKVSRINVTRDYIFEEREVID